MLPMCQCKAHTQDDVCRAEAVRSCLMCGDRVCFDCSSEVALTIPALRDGEHEISLRNSSYFVCGECRCRFRRVVREA